jgi:hypothetical protein
MRRDLDRLFRGGKRVMEASSRLFEGRPDL